MTALAEEIDRRLRTMPATKAKSLEKLILRIIGLAEGSGARSEDGDQQTYRTPSIRMGRPAGLDITRLGQLADDIE